MIFHEKYSCPEHHEFIVFSSSNLKYFKLPTRLIYYWIVLYLLSIFICILGDTMSFQNKTGDSLKRVSSSAPQNSQAKVAKMNKEISDDMAIHYLSENIMCIF